MPIGEYTIEGGGGTATEYGTSEMSLVIPTQSISITESTTSISITVTPTCALILIIDPESLTTHAYIEAPNQAFTEIDGFKYTYLKPQSGFHAMIYKTNGALLDILTYYLKLGYIYRIQVTNSEGSQQLILYPNFTEYSSIVW